MRDPEVRSTRRRVRVSVCQLIQVPQPRSVSMQIESFGENGASCKERAAHKAWRGRGNLGGRGICLSVIADWSSRIYNIYLYLYLHLQWLTSASQWRRQQTVSFQTFVYFLLLYLLYFNCTWKFWDLSSIVSMDVHWSVTLCWIKASRLLLKLSQQ